MIMATVADLPLGRSWPMSAYEVRRYRKSFGMSDEAGRDRCTALWKTYSMKRKPSSKKIVKEAVRWIIRLCACLYVCFCDLLRFFETSVFET